MGGKGMRRSVPDVTRFSAAAVATVALTIAAATWSFTSLTAIGH